MWIKHIWALTLLGLLLSIMFFLPFLSISSEKQVDASFLRAQQSSQAIVFFGFAHCADVCPTTMAVLRSLLIENDSSRALPQVAFIDIDRNSNQRNAEQYARQFHPEFIGYHPTSEHLDALSDDFGLNFRQLETSVLHRGRTYLLNRDANNTWWLVKTYNPDTFEPATLQQDLYL